MKSMPIETFVLEQKAGKLPKDVVIIDVRMDGEFAMSHLENAINIDVSHPNFMQAVAKLDKTKPYVVYCASGGRSAAAAQMMAAIGFTDVTDLLGGMMSLM